MMFRFGLFLTLCSFPLISHAEDLPTWLTQEKIIATQNLLANILPNGAVAASPSLQNPNYYKHWIRDSALTMEVVLHLYEVESNPTTKSDYFQKLMKYVEFSKLNQITPNLSGGLGEPLFYVDGSPFNQNWGRPQNDGPALRASVLTRLATLMLAAGQSEQVKQNLYSAVIKNDLDYVAQHQNDTCFDLWEETHGHHFFTQLVQRRALLTGADLADRLADKRAAALYRQQAKALENLINAHWDDTKQILVSTLDRDGGVDYKNSGLDASVIIAVLEAEGSDGFFAASDERVLATAEHLAETFKSLYPINQIGPGIAIGRYPEDQYDGTHTGAQGNPWFLLTNAFSQFYYRVASELVSSNQLTISKRNLSFFQSLLPQTPLKVGQVIHFGDSLFRQLSVSLLSRADSYLNRTRFHTAANGDLSEQMNRYTGFEQGAVNLTWSDDSLLQVAWEQAKLLNHR